MGTNILYLWKRDQLLVTAALMRLWVCNKFYNVQKKSTRTWSDTFIEVCFSSAARSKYSRSYQELDRVSFILRMCDLFLGILQKKLANTSSVENRLIRSSLLKMFFLYIKLMDWKDLRIKSFSCRGRTSGHWRSRCSRRDLQSRSRETNTRVNHTTNIPSTIDISF